METKSYLCIDLKSFYASVESVERGLDPMKVNLVVADPSRGKGAICLAITPAMKALGIKNRCRLFEISPNVSYITAVPRMKLYMKYSANIYSIYLKFISAEDIHVYSVDECFIDITQYKRIYKKNDKELANMLIDEVYKETGIRATVGIGTNLFLAKVALDITAKKAKDFIGVLDEEEFKRSIWHHRPITDIWNVGNGIAKRLAKVGIYDLYGVAHFDEAWMYREFGVNAEFLIDHAWGREPCTIADIHAYRSKSKSLSNSQILFEDYNSDDAMNVMQEMVDALVLEMFEQHLVCSSISLFIRYSKDAIAPSGTSVKLREITNSYKKLRECFTESYKKIVRSNYPIRQIGISLNDLLDESYATFDLFTDLTAEEKERQLQKTVLDIKRRYGKNAILKGISYTDKCTARTRNKLVGGHNGGEI
ncbi:MAG: DNA repair protein [Clostridia bacterium]|nr:DNA repair protein [Clostridia bacterium]